MKYVKIKVVNSNGSPQSGSRVAIHVSQFAASGSVPEKYTDSNGEVNFSLDIDNSAEITVYVEGKEKVRQGSVCSEYFITN